ncbi:hypothetical protein BBK82_05375 [Lentzea guizhouensis]|uniref:Uncharacterized protein n=1 Tax=Lentzea guizhouensis TaxID=1586287 RepID=A0A1B2HCZ4_9PSEU|nr:hypothetical protein [Lentzea guizhouensis]ANZ35595.1 hypothetical protein BBK82_05375 [Lentzea guizhouensis]
MNITPEVPQLDPVRVQVRKHALLNEIAARPARRWWRVAAPVSALAVTAVVAAAVWWGQPPRTGDPELGARTPGEAVRQCTAPGAPHMRLRTEHNPKIPPNASDVALVRDLGDVTIAVFLSAEGAVYCVAGPDRQFVPAAPQTAGQWFATFPYLGSSGARGVVVGKVRSGVRSVVATSALGEQTRAVPADGWVVLHMPGSAVATSVTTYDMAGGVLETVPVS